MSMNEADRLRKMLQESNKRRDQSEGLSRKMLQDMTMGLNIGSGKGPASQKETAKPRSQGEAPKKTRCVKGANTYEISDALGEGAFSKVWKGTRQGSGELVAIKSFSKNGPMYRQHRYVVETEIDLLENMDHPCIVTYHEAVETPKFHHVVLEYLGGGNLLKLVGNHRGLQEAEALRIFKQICEGLEYLHQVNVVHRDLKLENVLLDCENNVRIVDFGLAVRVKSAGTALSTICGTPEYQAPELHKKQAYFGHPVDVWSAGVILCALISGELPFTGINRQHVAKRVVRGVYQLPAGSAPCLHLIQGMLCLEAQDRILPCQLEIESVIARLGQ